MKPPICQYDLGDRDLRGHGCTIASLTYAARHVNPDAWTNPTTYALALRNASGVSLATFRQRGTTLREAKVAYEKAPGFSGRVKPYLRLLRGQSVRDVLMPLLRDGSIAVVAVNYGVIQDAGKGVGSFRGGHAVVIGEPEDQHVTVADPLRRELVRWRVGLLENAMESFGKNPWLNGRGEAAIPYPSPTLLDRAKAQRDAARRERDAARAEATLARTTADELRAALTDAGKRIRELEAVKPDCSDKVAAARTALLDDLAVWTMTQRGAP